MPLGLGIWEIVILLGIVALLFGTARVPEIGRKLGRGMREVKDAVADVDPRTMLEDEPAPARKADDATNRG